MERLVEEIAETGLPASPPCFPHLITNNYANGANMNLPKTKGIFPFNRWLAQSRVRAENFMSGAQSPSKQKKLSFQ